MTTQTKQQHTPLPWIKDGRTITDKDHAEIALFYHEDCSPEEAEKNTEIAVWAVNSHEELIMAANKFLEEIDHVGGIASYRRRFIKAVAKAECREVIK